MDNPIVRAAGYGLVVVFAVLPALFLALNEPFYLDVVARMMIFGIAALSLDLILGFGGMISLGHAVYLGIGGYAVGILNFYGIYDGATQFGAAVLVSAFAALLIGAVSLRTSGVFFLMITLAFNQMVYFLAISINTFGGDDGLTLTRPSEVGLNLRDSTTFYYFVLAALALVLFMCDRVVGSRFGMLIRGIKYNESRMVAIGFPTFRYKLAAFVIAGAICGFAGALLANQTLFVSPSLIHWSRSGELLVMVIAGGASTLVGPIIGAVLYLLLEKVISGWTVYWGACVGISLVLLVLVGKRGVLGLIGTRARRRNVQSEMLKTGSPTINSRVCAMPEILLATEGLSKCFGGVIANEAIDLEVRRGDLHAIIGPNGAGKTTLLAQLAGQLHPNRGVIRFAGKDVTHVPAHVRARNGFGRSFQITNVVHELTARDNVALAVQALQSHSFRFWRRARSDRSLLAPAELVLHAVGLEHCGDTLAGELSHGEKRALDIGMALAARPQLLLLDEPLAGMGAEDAPRIIKLLAELKAQTTILLIEHDMDAVFTLAEVVSVLVAGRIIASGSPAEIRKDAGVQRAYLGDEDEL